MLEKNIDELRCRINQEQNYLNNLTNDIINKENLCSDNNKQIIDLVNKINEFEGDYNRAFFNSMMRIDILFKVILVMLSTVIAGVTYQFSNSIFSTFLAGLITISSGTISYGYWVTIPGRESTILNNSDELLKIAEDIKNTKKILNDLRDRNILLCDELNGLKSNYENRLQYFNELNKLIEMDSLDYDSKENDNSRPLTRIRRREDDKN